MLAPTAWPLAGNIWFVENAFDQIARVDRTTGKFDEHPLGLKHSVARKL